MLVDSRPHQSLGTRCSTWSTIIWLSFTLGDVKTLTVNHSWCPAKCVYLNFFGFRYQTAPENCLVPCYAPLRCLGLIKDAPFRGYPFGLFIDPCILAQDYKSRIHPARWTWNWIEFEHGPFGTEIPLLHGLLGVPSDSSRVDGGLFGWQWKTILPFAYCITKEYNFS